MNNNSLPLAAPHLDLPPLSNNSLPLAIPHFDLTNGFSTHDVLDYADRTDDFQPMKIFDWTTDGVFALDIFV